MPTTREHLIYIHGVSHNNNQSHLELYDQLHDGILSKQKSPNVATWRQSKRCNVEWGWNYDKAKDPEADRLLAEAQEQFADKVLNQTKATTDWSLNPTRLIVQSLRQIMIKGFSDMFYYSSRDGKSSIRETVASQILKCIQQPLEADQPISLTFLTHSAGSVIAFDFLFYLFAPEEVVKAHEFIELAYDSDTNSTSKDFKKLRELADSNKLRVRRLVTLGSPISMLSFRSNAVLKILAEGNGLNPSYYGLDKNPEIFGNALSEPRWINFWDKDDLISWPVSSLMQKSAAVKDIYLDVGDSIRKSHNQYWSNEAVYENIAARW